MKVLVFDSEKTNGYAQEVLSLEDAHIKARSIISSKGYKHTDWELFEQSKPQSGEATFVYSHPCRFENITLFEV